MAIVMFVDGVIRNDKNNAPIRDGLHLYNHLNQTNKVLLLAEDKEKADLWLRQQKLHKFDDILDWKIVPPGENVWVRMIQYIRSQGPVDLVITSELDIVKSLLEVGVTSMAFCHPTYLDYKFRPDGREGRKSWDDITSELDRQQEMLAKDGRL